MRGAYFNIRVKLIKNVGSFCNFIGYLGKERSALVEALSLSSLALVFLTFVFVSFQIVRDS